MLRLLVLSVAITVALSESISTVDAKVKTFFSAMDKDGNGQASYQEFSDSIFAMDTDKNMKVIYREYAKATNADPILGRLLFNYLDSDADGHLDADDITVTFHQFDVDHSSGISIHEFITSFESPIAIVCEIWSSNDECGGKQDGSPSFTSYSNCTTSSNWIKYSIKP